MLVKTAITLIVQVIILLVVGTNVCAGDLSEGIDNFWLKSIISIEALNDSGAWIPQGTGFLMRSPQNHSVLVTAKHVIIDTAGSVRSDLGYRVNRKEGTYYVISDSLLTAHAGPWLLSQTFDVAVRIFGVKKKSDSDVESLPQDRLRNIERLKAGALVLVPGFPLGFRSEKYADPVVRRGVVARVDDSSIIIDAMLLRGNSGSPVIYTPTMKLGTGLTSPFINEERVIGVVSWGYSERKIATDVKDSSTTILYKDNAGLSKIVPVEYLSELLSSAEFLKMDSTQR